MTVDNYDPAGSLSAYYPSRAGRVIARIWAREKTLHDLADFGAVQFFEGGGSDPTALPGYATGKLWLRVDEGVTEEAATVRYYAGGTASLLASWPELDREGFAAHLGAKSAGELDLVWSTAISGDPGTGKVRGNHATLASITSIAISKTGRQGQSYSARIALMDDDDIVRVYGAGDDSSYVDVRITGAPSDQTTYYTIPCAVRAATSLSDGHLVGLSHHPTATSIDTAQDWAEKIDGAVDGANGYSSKAWAIGGTGVTNTAARGSAKDWATNAEDSTVDGSGYSSLHYAAKASAARDAALAAQAAAISASTAAEAAQSGAEAAQSGAEAAQSGAEAARDAAFANADVYADIATGRAAVADGEQFMVVSSDEIIRYRRDSSSTHTEMARYPSSGLTMQIVRDTIGPIEPVASGSTVANLTVYYWPDTSTDERYISDLELGVQQAGSFNVFVVEVEGDGSLTHVSTTVVQCDTTGQQTVSGLDILIPAGCVYGVANKSGKLYYTAGAGETMWYSATPTTSTAKTITTTVRTHHRATVKGTTLHKADYSYEQLAAFGSTGQSGWPTVVNTGTDVPASYVAILAEPMQGDGRLTAVTIGSDDAGSVATAVVVTMSGTTVTAITAQQQIVIESGAVRYPINLEYEAGQFIGLINGYKYQASTNPQKIEAYIKSGGLAAGQTVTLASLHRYEFRFEYADGLLADVHDALESATTNSIGSEPLADADATGVADATAAFASARASHPHPYVRPGIFAVTALTAFAAGLWGPGVVNLNGKRFFLPADPTPINLYHGLRAALAPEIANGAPLVLIGDSISHWAHASTGDKHWLNMLTAFANITGSPGDQPVMTALRPSSMYTPEFYGVTTSGTVSTGTNGPLGESLVLAAGASISFTGAYEQVDVFYTQQSGAGSLAFAYNGGAAYKTVTAAGATDLDHYSGPSATGQTASGTYTITASAGPVEITGLVRLGVKAANTPERLLTHRSGHGSYQFTSFGASAVTSILKQCAALSSTPPYVVIALGINDRAALTPSDYAAMKTRAQTLVDLLQAGGVTRIAAIMPQEPTSGWSATYSGKLTQGQLWGALTEVYLAEGVTIVPTHKYDAAGEGLLSDGLHPNDAGNAKMAQVIIEALGQ